MQGPLPQGFGPGIEAQLAAASLEQAARGRRAAHRAHVLRAAVRRRGHRAGPACWPRRCSAPLGALAVLLFVFASFLALVPLIIAAVSILTTFLLVLGLTYVHRRQLRRAVPDRADRPGRGDRLLAAAGLPLARGAGARARQREAVVIAMKTAGHAVVASGVTVAISLLALVVVPVPFLRSMGLGGMLIPLVSVVVVLTLLPAMLSKIGPRVDWPRIRHEAVAARGWSAWARLIVRRRWIAAGVGAGRARAAHRAGLRPEDRPGRHRLAGQQRAGATTPCRRCEEGGVGDGVLTPDRGAGARRPGRRRGRGRATASTASGWPSSAAASDGDHASSTSSRDARRPTAPASRWSTTSATAVEGATDGERRGRRRRRDRAGLLPRGVRQLPLRPGADRA